MNDPRSLRLFYDYVDPASFLLERRLRRLEGPTTFFLKLEPMEISPPPSGMVDPEDPTWARHWARMEKEGQRLGIALRRPWIVPSSRKAHELALHAAREGCFPEIHDALFRAYLQEGLDIGRIDLLVDLARRQGLKGAEAKGALDVDLFRETLEEKRKEALEEGVTHPPALLWQGRIIPGYPDDDALNGVLGVEK